MDNKGTITWIPPFMLPPLKEGNQFRSDLLLLLNDNSCFPSPILRIGYYNFDTGTFINKDDPEDMMPPTHWAYINLPE